MIFFPIFRHVAAPWWPNTEINMTEMLYPDRFHELPQVCYSLCMFIMISIYDIFIFSKFRHIDAPWWPNTEINITEMKYPDTFHELLQDCNSLCM